MSAANRRRGADAERSVVAYLRKQGWPDARRYLAGDGRQPGDIDAIPGVSIEVKDVKASAWPSWCEQAVEAAGGRIPIVVRRTRGVTDVGLWQARIRQGDWDTLGGPLDPHFYWCRRTHALWQRSTFGELVELLRDEVTL